MKFHENCRPPKMKSWLRPWCWWMWCSLCIEFFPHYPSSEYWFTCCVLFLHFLSFDWWKGV